MEGVESRAVDHCALMAHQHLAGILKRIDYYCSRVAEFDLKDRLTITAPPFLADRSVVIAKL